MSDGSGVANATSKEFGELGSRLVKAQSIARAVGKDGRNAFHGYRYASAEAIIEEARGALSEAGLAVFAAKWTVVQGPVVKDAKGRDTNGVGSIDVYYVLMGGGETARLGPFTTAVVPDSGRPQDKAEATALTYSLGYFLRALLLLPRVDEAEEVDRRNDAPAKPKPAREVPHDPATGEVREAVPGLGAAAAHAMIERLAKGFADWDEKRAWRQANADAKKALPEDLAAAVSRAFSAAPPVAEKK